MSPELTAFRQNWYNKLTPGTLVRYTSAGIGYIDKPALIVSVHNISSKSIPSGRPIAEKEYVILVDEITKKVYQGLIYPFDGWSSLSRKNKRK